MKYDTGKWTVDELVGYFKTDKINLIPPFQRGRPWSLNLRKKLLENILRGKPIPAIFLYKQQAGQMFTYNILDGKQRLESILLFVTNTRAGIGVPNWKNYFFQGSTAASFAVNIAPDSERRQNKTFAQLDDEMVADFREYKIPTIEIQVDKDEASLKELIDLFIDINQYGVKVNRFDIVKTMYDSNPLLSGIFSLVAEKRKRKGDNFYKIMDTEFTRVLKHLAVVKNLTVLTMDKDTKLAAIEKSQERADRMWERLLEIALFIRTKKHRTLAQILKVFDADALERKPLTGQERASLQRVFKFIGSLYRVKGVTNTKLASDQPFFYTMVTTIYAEDLLKRYPHDLKERVARLAFAIDDPQSVSTSARKTLRDYVSISTKQTTHPGRREARQELFAKLIEAI